MRFSVICRLLALLFICLPFWAYAGRVVEFKELNAGDAESLRNAIPQLKSDNVDPATLDEALRWLMSKGKYENAFIESADGGNYTITGKPLRTIQAINFTGVRDVSERDLRRLLDFSIGDRFDRKKAVLAGERMKAFYGENGYFNTIIELNFEKTESKDVRLVFDIIEKKPCKIRSLIFTTPNTDLKDLLERKFRYQTGRPLTVDRVNSMMSDLQELLVENRYLATEVIGPDVKYNHPKTEAYLEIEIREPQKWEFYFEGNKAFSTLDIYRALDLRNRERKNVDPANEGAERLRRTYLEKGYPNVTIDTKVEAPKGSFLRRVHYTINEGLRVKVASIQVEGRVSRTSKYYQDFILENSSDLVSSGYYNRQALDNGFKNMETELHNQGFLHARILSSRVEFNTKRDRVTVFLILEEGPQTQIRALDFLGNKFFSGFELAKVTELQANAPLRLNEFEASLQKLKSFYQDQGFLEMKLLNESEDIIQYNEKGTQARITFQIYEGPRIRINSIAVEGNTKTKTRVILKEAGFSEGEILTPDKVSDSTSRLNRMGLFSRVNVRTLEEGTTVSERTLVISVAERDPGAFTFGGGVTNERKLTLRGYTGLGYNNLWGTARAISGRAEIRSNTAEINFPESDLTAGYLEPFIFDTRTRGRVNLTRSEYVFDYKSVLTADKTEYKVTEIIIKNRIDLLTERDLTTHTKFTFKAWSLESRRDFERHYRCIPDETLATPPKFDPKSYCPPNVMQVATIGPQLDIDYRDNPFLPTRGSFTRLSTNYSTPSLGSSPGVKFIKYEAEHRFYQRLGSPRWVWANSARGGYVRNLSHDIGSGVPSDSAFVLGGIYSLRGFDIASPLDRVPADGNGKTPSDENGFVLGQANQKIIKNHSEYYLFKSELRYPIYGDTLGGVIFYDGGAVYVSNYDFHRPYRDAVGLGLRVNTPVGPASLDFAWKLNPERAKGESAWRWYFYVGTF
jgi:outer membrane protein assembly complex protein YaeT